MFCFYIHFIVLFYAIWPYGHKNEIKVYLLYFTLLYFRLDYSYFLYYCVPKSQLNRLQRTQNVPARAVVVALRSSNPDHIIRSLHWLKVQERIECKVMPARMSSPVFVICMIDFITVQLCRSIWSSTLVTLLRRRFHPSLKMANQCFQHVYTFTSLVEQASSYSLCSPICSPPPGSDPELVVAIFIAFSTLVLNPPFFKVFPSMVIYRYPLLRLIFGIWPLSVWQ